MRLAFVTSLVVDGKPMTGFEVANEAVVTALQAIGCEVTVIGFRQPRQGKTFAHDTIILDSLDVENAGASFSQKLRWMASALVSGLPVGGSKLRVVPWGKLENALSSIHNLDGIVINSIQIATAFPQLLDYAPFAYVSHNVENQSAKQNSVSSDGSLSRFLYSRDARLLKPIENALCQKAGHVFCLSEDDRQTFGLGVENASILPLVFPENQSSDAAKSAGEKEGNETISHDIGLIGTWSWQPNLVGLLWFLDDVVPLLDRDLNIQVAGNLPPVAKPDHPGVHFAGRVESAEEFVTQSRVLALVSRSGTGVQLKSIEAFQMGMPCVATDSSVRGIAAVPDNCRVENDSSEFAKALNELVKLRRNGEVGREDGSKFADQQRQQLHKALKKGLSFMADETSGEKQKLDA